MGVMLLREYSRVRSISTSPSSITPLLPTAPQQSALQPFPQQPAAGFDQGIPVWVDSYLRKDLTGFSITLSNTINSAFRTLVDKDWLELSSEFSFTNYWTKSKRGLSKLTPLQQDLRRIVATQLPGVLLDRNLSGSSDVEKEFFEPHSVATETASIL